MASLLLEDIFEVEDLNPGGKKLFEKGASRAARREGEKRARGCARKREVRGAFPLNGGARGVATRARALCGLRAFCGAPEAPQVRLRADRRELESRGGR